MLGIGSALMTGACLDSCCVLGGGSVVLKNEKLLNRGDSAAANQSSLGSSFPSGYNNGERVFILEDEEVGSDKSGDRTGAKANTAEVYPQRSTSSWREANHQGLGVVSQSSGNKKIMSGRVDKRPLKMKKFVGYPVREYELEKCEDEERDELVSSHFLQTTLVEEQKIHDVGSSQPNNRVEDRYKNLSLANPDRISRAVCHIPSLFVFGLTFGYLSIFFLNFEIYSRLMLVLAIYLLVCWDSGIVSIEEQLYCFRFP